MVGISYTNTRGEKTVFRSSSADEAITRLQRIPGYAKTSADEVAAGLGKGWRERHRERMEKNRNKQRFGGTGGAQYSYGSGVVSTVKSVTNIRVENGKLVTTSQDNYVAENGTTVGVGPKRTKTISTNIGDVKTVNGHTYWAVKETEA